MLVKKKLLQISPQPCPEGIVLPCKSGRTERMVTCQVTDGIVIADIYDNKGVLTKRFFADGSSWQYYDVKQGTWNQRQNYSVYRYGPEEVYITAKPGIPEDIQQVLGAQAYGKEALDHYLWRYTQRIADEKRRRYEEKKYSRIRGMEEASAIKKEEMADFSRWLLEDVFPAISEMSPKGRNGKNQLRCLTCGCRRQVKGLKHKGSWRCPKCGRCTTVYEKRYITSRRDKEDIAVAEKVPGGWSVSGGQVKRTFDENGKQDWYYIRDQIDYHGEETKKLYCPSNSQYGFKFARYPLDGEYILYPGNLEKVFAEDMGMQKLLKKASKQKTGVFTILDHKDNPTIHKLLKAGLHAMITGSHWKRGVDSFEELTGISQNYFHAFREMGYGWGMVGTIQAFTLVWMKEGTYNPQQLEIMDSFGTRFGVGANKLAELAKYMTDIKCINYFHRQMLQSGKSFGTLADWYLDYVSMAEYLASKGIGSIDLKQTYYRFPRDIKETHDRMEKQYRAIKNKKKNEEISQKAEDYRMIPQPSGKFMAIFPDRDEDFMDEGNALHHCVGWNPVYRSGQADGSMITFFIRKKKEPEKPYFTATYRVNKAQATFRESYGQNHKPPGEEVKRFIDAFMENVNVHLKGASA